MSDREIDVLSSPVVDSRRYSDDQCIVYKFQSRPPYEGFVLILLIICIAIFMIWWLHSPPSYGKE